MKKGLVVALRAAFGSVVTLAIILAYVPWAGAMDRYVPGNYPSIQAAINAAIDGDVVIVAPGTYYERITFPNNLGITDNKAITVQSSDPGNPAVVNSTIIDGSYGGTVVTFKVNTNVNKTVLSGFTIQNGNGDYGGGIYCYNSSPTIEKCIIHYNTAYAGGGIYCLFSQAMIKDCSIYSNEGPDGGGGGIYCDNSSSSEIKPC